MKSLLEEIREQPPHIREVFMWVCVVITFSVVSFAWFRSTTKQIIAMVNPDQVEVSSGLAQNTSPFATIFSSVKDLQANIGELFNFANKSTSLEIQGSNTTQTKNLPLPPQKLPLSKNKK